MLTDLQYSINLLSKNLCIQLYIINNFEETCNSSAYNTRPNHVHVHGCLLNHAEWVSIKKKKLLYQQFPDMLKIEDILGIARNFLQVIDPNFIINILCVLFVWRKCRKVSYKNCMHSIWKSDKYQNLAQRFLNILLPDHNFWSRVFGNMKNK